MMGYIGTIVLKMRSTSEVRDLSHFCGLEKSSEANFIAEFVKCRHTYRYSSLLVAFLSDSSTNNGCLKEESRKKKNKAEKDFLPWE